MTNHRSSHLAQSGPDEISVPNIDSGPIISYDERQFLAGKIGPDEYLRRGQDRAEMWITAGEHMAPRPTGRSRSPLHLFAAFAATLYLLLATVFYLVDLRSAAVLSMMVSLFFMAAITLYMAFRRED